MRFFACSPSSKNNLLDYNTVLYIYIRGFIGIRSVVLSNRVYVQVRVCPTPQRMFISLEKVISDLIIILVRS